MNEPVVIVAIVTGAFGLLNTGIGLIAVKRGHTANLTASRALSHSRNIDTQITNNHTSNFREDGDEQHRTVVTRLELIHKDIGGIRHDGRNRDTRLNRIDDRLGRLEDFERTQPREDQNHATRKRH